MRGVSKDMEHIYREAEIPREKGRAKYMERRTDNGRRSQDVERERNGARERSNLQEIHI